MGFIVIGGILLVIAMVIVSTKIKKSAAEAFLLESIEKDDFKVEKPEGFLHPLRDVPEFPFEAYSKTYGDKGTRNIWRARVRLRIFEKTNLRNFVNEIKRGNENIDSEKQCKDLPANQSGLILRSHKTEDDIDYKILRKIIGLKSQSKIYELKTTILVPYEDEYTDKSCEMMQSFVVK